MRTQAPPTALLVECNTLHEDYVWKVASTCQVKTIIGACDDASVPLRESIQYSLPIPCPHYSYSAPAYKFGKKKM